MLNRERRLQATRPDLWAIAILAGTGLWCGCQEGVTEAAAPPEVVAPPTAVADVLPVLQPDRALTAEIRAIVQRSKALASKRGADAGSLHVSVVVEELGSEGALVEIEPDRRARPASNMKLFTTALALSLLGSHADFETQFAAKAPIQRGALQGDLYVRAGYDPLYRDGSLGECERLLEPVVRALREAGVDRVDGDLVLELGSSGSPAPAPGWPSADQHWKDYCALASGFSANAGCITLQVISGSPGEPAEVLVHPLGHGARVKNEAVTSAKGSTLKLMATVGADRIRVWGSIPADVTVWEEGYAHEDPVQLFGSVLLSALANGGVSVGGSLRVERGSGGGRTLAVLRSPIITALGPINRDSNNGVADQLFYKVGADVIGMGDRRGGAQAAIKALEDLGLSLDGFTQVDGSGLSRHNRVTARQLVRLLNSVISEADDGADEFMRSLAHSGKTGTLSDRMLGTSAEGRVLGKSGWIGGTSALSGVALCEGDRMLVFSVLVDYEALGALNTVVWKPMQDDICEALILGS